MFNMLQLGMKLGKILGFLFLIFVRDTFRILTERRFFFD